MPIWQFNILINNQNYFRFEAYIRLAFKFFSMLFPISFHFTGGYEKGFTEIYGKM